MPDMLRVPFPSSRQRRLYTFLVDLYAPSTLSADTAGFQASDDGDVEASDQKFAYPAAFTNVHCFYEPTPEFTNVAPLGLNKEENVFTSDKWHFFASQEINDGWMIVMKAAAVPASLIGRCWITQGNSEIITSSRRRPVSAQWIYAKLSPTDIKPTS